jgi:hypothetical protein
MPAESPTRGPRFDEGHEANPSPATEQNDPSTQVAARILAESSPRPHASSCASMRATPLPVPENGGLKSPHTFTAPFSIADAPT